MKVVRYQRPRLYPKQEEAIFCSERYSVIEASTKTGKTVGCLVWLHEQAALYGEEGRNYWWVAPIRSTAKIAYKRLKKFLPDGAYRTNESDLTITLANGAVIWFKSAHDPDALYGEDVYAAVIDEATRTSEDSWIALRTTLTATQGPLRIIGNVKGRKNWAYRLARRAEHGTPNMHYSRLTAYDAVAGGVLKLEEVEDAKRMLPKQAFEELYLAIPGDDGSNPFGREAIEECTVQLRPDTPRVWGWDLARKRDWTVGIGLDGERRTVAFERFQHPWAAQINKIHKVTGLVPALVDQTGVGDPITEQLQAKGGNYTGFTFTPKSRQQILESLALKITGHEIYFPEFVAEELDSFEYVYTPTGVKYAAPEGMHDDCVMALAMANHHFSDAGVPDFSWI